MERTLSDGRFKLNAYAVQSRLDLFSNFSYFLENPIDLDPAAVNGDQFEQAEQRKVFGLATSRSWNTQLGGRDTTFTAGLQLRHDRLDPVGLYSTVARVRAATIQESTVRQTSGHRGCAASSGCAPTGSTSRSRVRSPPTAAAAMPASPRPNSR
jgi:hypothetical protein